MAHRWLKLTVRLNCRGSFNLRVDLDFASGVAHKIAGSARCCIGCNNMTVCRLAVAEAVHLAGFCQE